MSVFSACVLRFEWSDKYSIGEVLTLSTVTL